MAKKAQRMHFTQCNKERIDDGVTDLIFVVYGRRSFSGTPLGSLTVHPLSCLLEYATLRNFSKECKKNGYTLHRYERVSYQQVAQEIVEKDIFNEIVMMKSSEPYVNTLFVELQEKTALYINFLPNRQFFIDHESFQEQFSSPPVMETFYRRIRKKTGVLMEGQKPDGGKRNYDKLNRGFDKEFTDVARLTFEETEGLQKAKEFYKDLLDQIDEDTLSTYPTNRVQAKAGFDYFLTELLDRFGELEDAMYDTSPFVYHSLLSFSLNIGLLSCHEVVSAVESTDTAMQNKEGFVRQVLGRREYMYHRYAVYQDSIYEKNHFGHQRSLPEWFWRPDKSPLEMHCVNHVLEKVSKYGYAHHIERLMIIGNFCLLVGYAPTDVTKRFREQFVDAFERVVTPNVMGMSQYADGGNLATKPYVASANYVNKMSNFCKKCVYDPKKKYGEDACPLNYLYRNFLDTNRETFKNGRQSFILKHLEKIDVEKIREQTNSFIDSLENS